jgi:Predicted transcriptional regulator/sugar kinase
MPCALWRGLDHLHQAIDRIEATMQASDACVHAVTMTGEMVDLFETRQAGVQALVALLSQRLGADRVRFYAGGQGWYDAGQASQCAGRVASANWHATAHLVSTCISEALLVDIGSTTTDLIPIRDGLVATPAAATATACPPANWSTPA